jgi:hypothetical protein
MFSTFKVLVVGFLLASQASLSLMPSTLLKRTMLSLAIVKTWTTIKPNHKTNSMKTQNIGN